MKTTLNPEIDNTKIDILIVDDIPLNVTLIEKMLSPFHFTTRSANNGMEALDKIDEKIPSIVLLDLMMPGISGYDVLKKLRSDEKTSKLPVIILSALNSNEDVVRGFNLGANDFITKPILMDRLHNSVATQLNLAFAEKK